MAYLFIANYTMKLFYLLLLFLITGCSYQEQKSSQSQLQNSNLKYARGFSIDKYKGRTLVQVYNPWNDNSILATYELIPKGKTALTNYKSIQIPIETTACLSSTYLGMIAMLDARKSVIASSNANWIYDSILYQKYLDSKITNLGNDMTTSAEAVIGDNPDVVLKYIYQSPDPIDPIIEGAGIPVVYIIEFMEEHPLGRAEWIKLVGALLDKEAMADSIFNSIETNYKEYSLKANLSPYSPKVLDGTLYKGTWYAAGGKSFVASLLKNAGSLYLWHNDSTTGSIPLSFEVVLKKQAEADFWFNANAGSLNELRTIEPRCEVLNAFQKGNVYHYNKRVNPNGGLDYYESGVIRPDLLLRDLLVILHPGYINAETVYYKRLE